MEWQPIETAPRDGTWVLLCGGKTTEDFYTSEARHEDKVRPVVGFFDPSQWGDDGDDGYAEWSICFWDGAWRDGYCRPTHWMPLPSPPA